MTRVLCACLLAVGLMTWGAPTAEARGGPGVVEQNLMQRGITELRRAEQAYFRKDMPTAARHGSMAEKLFEDVLRQNPRHVTAALLGGQAAVFQRKLDRARAWVLRYRGVSRGGEGDPDLHYLRAFVHLLGEERPARALRSLQQMYSLNPRARPGARDTLWWIALSDLGRRHLEGGKVEDAARYFATGARVARRLGSREKEILMLADLGTTYMRAERYIEAAETFGGLAKIQPRSVLWSWRHGMALANQNRFPDAVAIYRKVLALQAEGERAPTDFESEVAELPMRLGNCLRHISASEPEPAKRAKLLDEAQMHLKAYIKAQPRDSRGPKWLGVLLMDNAEKPYEALKQLQQSFSIDPMCEDVLRRMVQIHARHPAPPGTDAADWKKRHLAMVKDMEEGAKRRKAEMDRREKKDGDNGCG